ncbi:hypothetical protein LTR09_009487 [Extremus antarcticus]|uniref:Uncharacterized protein n=1 Tax=Extremus antarcticus TaxID=702011 RepID=A0AAJ0G5P0_9PEZI|nr:hypothetical protein LTR09_009487 [Extremus antarcticus]
MDFRSRMWRVFPCCFHTLREETPPGVEMTFMEAVNMSVEHASKEKKPIEQIGPKPRSLLLPPKPTLAPKTTPVDPPKQNRDNSDTITPPSNTQSHSIGSSSKPASDPDEIKAASDPEVVKAASDQDEITVAPLRRAALGSEIQDTQKFRASVMNAIEDRKELFRRLRTPPDKLAEENAERARQATKQDGQTNGIPVAASGALS